MNRISTQSSHLFKSNSTFCVQWNPGNTTNHGTDVVTSVKLKIWGWISRLHIPAKKLCTVVSLVCMHDWGDARSPTHDKNSYFLEKDYSDSDISINKELIILSSVMYLGLGKYTGSTYTISKARQTLCQVCLEADLDLDQLIGGAI
jgi:hypothetical protein